MPGGGGRDEIRKLRTNDVVVITRLDRLARSTSELLRIAETIEEKNAGLQSMRSMDATAVLQGQYGQPG